MYFTTFQHSERGIDDREIGRMRFNVVDERSRIQPNDLPGYLLYPFRESRSRLT
jgi:hypothetical protein